MRRTVAAAAVGALLWSVPVVRAEEPVQVQPGDAITIGDSACTAGFLLVGSDGRSYLTTAGHCVFPDGGTAAWPQGDGPVVATAQGRVGRVVFAENMPSADGDDEYDFAVLRLDPAVEATADIRGIGGPTGLNEDRTPLPARLRTPGQGTGGRQLLTRTMERPEFVYAYGVSVPGDSGGPVVDDDGRAVGTLLGADDGTYDFGPDPELAGREGAANRIGRLGPVLVHASFATRTGFRLVLAG